jgi:hypothetical protein
VHLAAGERSLERFAIRLRHHQNSFGCDVLRHDRDHP